MTHPELDILAEMVATPESSPAAELVAHVSQCYACRKQLARLSRLQNRVQQGVSQSRLANEQVQQIADYVDDRLPADVQQEVAQQLQQDKRLLKAALHYAAGRSHYAKPGTPLQASRPFHGQAHRNDANWLQRLSAWFWQPSSAWTGMATAAAAVAIMAVALRPVFVTESVNGIALAPYQDTAQIEFFLAEQPPGIGFFSGARKSVQQAFSGVAMALHGDNMLRLNWPSVAQASGYKVALYEVSGDKSQLVLEQTTTRPEIELSLGTLNLRPGSRYQWELSGTTTDRKKFVARGGFVPVMVNQ